MTTVVVRALVVAATFAACSDAARREAPPVEPEVLAAEHEEWRANRQSSLARPNAGVISWAGLWDLEEGANRFGSDPSLPIVLPVEDSPPVAGTLHLQGGQVRLEPAEGSGLTLDAGDPVTAPMQVLDDRSGNTTVLGLGSLGLRIHAERGTDRLWLRAWDTDAPRIAAFELPPYFAVDQRVARGGAFRPLPRAPHGAAGRRDRRDGVERGARRAGLSRGWTRAPADRVSRPPRAAATSSRCGTRPGSRTRIREAVTCVCRWRTTRAGRPSISTGPTTRRACSRRIRCAACRRARTGWRWR